jgi:hypothetical protein
MASPVERPDGDIELSDVFHPFLVPGKVDEQRVNVLVNDVYVGTWKIRNSGMWNRIGNSRRSQTHKLIIPLELVSDSVMVLTFELPDAVSPARVGISEDERVLALAMRSVALRELFQ